MKTSRIIGNPKQRYLAYKSKAQIHLISRDNIAWLCGEFGGGKLPYDMLIIDESSSFKNHKSVRFKALRRVQPCFKRVVLLTGTPAPNTLIDLWSQIYLLDRGERLGKFIGHYRKEYFKKGRSNGHIVYNYLALENSESRIYEKIGDICLSMKSEDYLDLPERIDNYIKIKFPDKIKKRYLDFERSQILELLENEDEITAVNAAALSNKLLQFSNGAIYDQDKVVHEVHSLKLDALQEILEDANGKPVLVAWTYRSDKDRIFRRFAKYKPVALKTEGHISEWNEGKIALMCMHPASGGHGLNLQYGGSTIVWFGQTWSLELYQQFNARLHRQGQEETTIVHHLVAEGTVDEDVIASLSKKDKKQAGLMEAIKARIDKYEKQIKA